MKIKMSKERAPVLHFIQRLLVKTNVSFCLLRETFYCTLIKRDCNGKELYTFKVNHAYPP